MKKLFLAALLSMAATAVASAQSTVTITPTKSGLQIVGGGEHLKFMLGYPTLLSSWAGPALVAPGSLRGGVARKGS